MARVSEKVVLSADIQRGWELIASYGNYVSWRSDLKSVDGVTDNIFMETSKDNKRLMFYITQREPYSLLCFDMKNDVIQGYWTGKLSEADGKTILEMTEEAYTKKLLLKPVLNRYLKKQQSLFIEDLKRALDE